MLTTYSLGHYIVDSLADRLGVRLTYEKNVDGFVGSTTVELSSQSGRDVTVTLLKPSKQRFKVSQHTTHALITRRALHESFWSPRAEGSAPAIPFSGKTGRYPRLCKPQAMSTLAQIRWLG